VAGTVKPDGVTTSVTADGTISAVVGSSYTLPMAGADTLGGVKADTAGTGANSPVKLNVSTGHLSVQAGSDSVLGVVKGDGTTTTIGADGDIHSNCTYVLPVASVTVMGGVKSDGSTIAIDDAGVISVAGGSGYTLPVASDTVLGGVKAVPTGVMGQAVNVVHKDEPDSTEGMLTVPQVQAGSTGLGLVSVGVVPEDGKISVNTIGKISADKASGDYCGVVKPDGTTTTVTADGTISAVAGYTLPVASTEILGGVKPDGITTSVDGSGLLKSITLGIPHTKSGSTLSFTMQGHASDNNCFFYAGIISATSIPDAFEGFLDCYVGIVSSNYVDDLLRVYVDVLIKSKSTPTYNWGMVGNYIGLSTLPATSNLARVFVPKPANSIVSVTAYYKDKNGASSTQNPKFYIEKFI
jgi:hypothetical protein